jgi:DNA-binding CsgD family transcriptional regulator
MLDDLVQAAHLREILDIVAHSCLPVLVLRIPAQTVIAASPGAHELLGEITQPLVGADLAALIEEPSTSAVSLLVDGQITGFDALQVLKGTGKRRRLWVRALSHLGSTPAAIAVLFEDDPNEQAFVPLSDHRQSTAVVGSTDARLIVNRVSRDIDGVLGLRTEEIIGTSLLTLVVPADVAGVLSALAAMSQRKESVTLRVEMVGADLSPVKCRMMLLPMAPAPSCVFALLAEEADTHPADGRMVADLIARLSREIQGAMSTDAGTYAPKRSEVDLAHLSARELEIVSLLMAGDRVSSIAKLLFLSEGTIRNHLSSVFGKLGVGTQQELIEHLRPATVDGLDG